MTRKYKLEFDATNFFASLANASLVVKSPTGNKIELKKVTCFRIADTRQDLVQCFWDFAYPANRSKSYTMEATKEDMVKLLEFSRL